MTPSDSLIKVLKNQGRCRNYQLHFTDLPEILTDHLPQCVVPIETYTSIDSPRSLLIRCVSENFQPVLPGESIPIQRLKPKPFKDQPIRPDDLPESQLGSVLLESTGQELNISELLEVYRTMLIRRDDLGAAEERLLNNLAGYLADAVIPVGGFLGSSQRDND